MKGQKIVRGVVYVLAAVGVFSIGKNVVGAIGEPKQVMSAEQEKYIDVQPDFSVELLSVNEYSRPGNALDEVNGIVIHWTANPGTTAEQNRSYFEGLAESGETYASSHFIIGLSGEIIQCIPCNEIAYASKDRNVDTIAIECCTEGEDGAFNEATYDSLIQLTTWLMGRYDLTIDQVIRHYDVTGKDCPKYYVEHEEKWDEMKADMLSYIETYGIAKSDKIK